MISEGWPFEKGAAGLHAWGIQGRDLLVFRMFLGLGCFGQLAARTILQGDAWTWQPGRDGIRQAHRDDGLLLGDILISNRFGYVRQFDPLLPSEVLKRSEVPAECAGWHLWAARAAHGRN